MMTNEELKQAYNMFTDAWKLFKKYADIRDTDEYWESLVDEAGETAKQFDNDKFIRNLVMAVMDEIERRAKEMRNNAKTQQGI